NASTGASVATHSTGNDRRVDSLPAASTTDTQRPVVFVSSRSKDDQSLPCGVLSPRKMPFVAADQKRAANRPVPGKSAAGTGRLAGLWLRVSDAGTRNEPIAPLVCAAPYGTRR